MKLIIDIPQEVYQHYKKVWQKRRGSIPESYIANGTPLPTVNGDLILLSKDKLKENLIDLSFSSQQWIDEVGLSFATLSIIKADKEDEEE